MPEKMKTKYGEIFDLNSVLLSKNDLFILERMLIEDPETDRINIQISFNSTRVSAESFEELFSDSDLPASTDKLSINMTRSIETEKYIGSYYSVRLTLSHNYIDCQISSPDQTWFLGKKSQIENFFKSKRPWYLWLNKLSFVYSGIVIALIFYSSAMLGIKQYSQMILPIISSIVFIVLTILIYKQKIFPFVRIHLQERTKIKFGFAEWCALIVALSAFATLVQVLSKLFR